MTKNNNNIIIIDKILLNPNYIFLTLANQENIFLIETNSISFLSISPIPFHFFSKKKTNLLTIKTRKQNLVLAMCGFGD